MAPCDAKKEIDRLNSEVSHLRQCISGHEAHSRLSRSASEHEIGRLNRENAALIALVAAIESKMECATIHSNALVLVTHIRSEIDKAPFNRPEPSNE